MIRHLLLVCMGCAVLEPLPAAAAGADQLPIRKAGLWEIKMTRTGSPMPAITMQHCTDETTDRAMNSMGSPGAGADQACSKRELRKTATGYASDSVCTIAGRSITAHADVVGDFNSAYTVTIVSHSEGGPAGARDTTSKLEAKWVGACKGDQKPGDVVTPDGRTINVIDLQKRKSMAPTR